MLEAELVAHLQQAGTELAMHFDRSADDII
jgi:hypothetical protein